VSGIIASDLVAKSSGSSLGIGGVCPVCKILPVKIISTIGDSGSAADESIIAALQYISLFRSGDGGVVRVVNSSFGKYAPNRAVELLVNVLSESATQVLVVAAASNEDSMLRSYPAAYPGALGVAATGPADEKASYSNFGPWVQVAAPGGDQAGGEEITSTLPGGGTGQKEGTSMAAPVVAGVAGLVLSYDQTRTVAALRSSIVNTADPRLYDPSVNNGINYNYYDPLVAGYPNRWPLLGSGIVDAAAALDGVVSTYPGTVYDRVQPGCGTVAAYPIAPLNHWWLWLLPLLLAVFL
jgi:thermitase